MHDTHPCRPRSPMHVEHEYFRCGAWTYIAALDAHHARIFGRCESKNGIAPIDRLVASADQTAIRRRPSSFQIVDNCSVHRGVKAAERLRSLYPGPYARAAPSTPVGLMRKWPTKCPRPR